MKTTRMFIGAVGAAILFLFLGCGKAPNLNSGTMIGNMPAEAFYDQMSYKVMGQPSPHSSRYLTAPEGSQMVLQNLPGNKKMYADISLFLMSNHQFTLIYDESVGCSTGQTVIKNRVTHNPVQGYWSVQGTSLVLGGVGTGQGAAIDSVPSLVMQFSKDLGHQGLRGQSALLQSGIMPTNLDDNEINGYVTDINTASQALDASHVCVSK